MAAASPRQAIKLKKPCQRRKAKKQKESVCVCMCVCVAEAQAMGVFVAAGGVAQRLPRKGHRAAAKADKGDVYDANVRQHKA